MTTPKRTITIPDEFYKASNFFTLGGAASAVWIFLLVLGYIEEGEYLGPKIYRIIAFTLSEAIAVLIILRSRRKKKLEHYVFAFFNGLLIFINASGFNIISKNLAYIESSVNEKKEEKVKAEEASFTYFLSNSIFKSQVNWWEPEQEFKAKKRLINENRALEVKLEEVKKEYRVLSERIKNNHPDSNPSINIDSILSQMEILRIENLSLKQNTTKSIDKNIDEKYVSNTKTVVSADKMNILYRGVKNPISVATFCSSLISVTASGNANIIEKNEEYFVDVTNYEKDEIKITIVGKYQNGSKFKDSKSFRIKNIATPRVVVRDRGGNAMISKSSLKQIKVGVKVQDFHLDSKLAVIEFKIRIKGDPQPAITIRGDIMNENAKEFIDKTNAGDIITIFDIKTKLVKGPSFRAKKIYPFDLKITD